MPVTIATEKDIPELVQLLNSAYRGEASKKGWTTEADLIAGERRTDEPTLLKLMQDSTAVFLKYVNELNETEGCVYLQQRANKLYFGMLAVSPLLQAKGTGKKLVKALEDYALQKNYQAVFMRVVSGRDELIRWYERLGYQQTGATESFPDDDRFGTPRQPLHFIIMEKQLRIPETGAPGNNNSFP